MPVEYKQSELPAWFEDFSDQNFDQNRTFKLYGKTRHFQWNDLESAALCGPQHYELALSYIKRFLGYFPEQHIYLPHMAFIQTLLEKSEAKLMGIEIFWQEMTDQMKLLRNDDMKKSGWLNHVWPDGDTRDFSKVFLIQYKDAARKRLTSLLGFEPKIKYSLEPELLLRSLFEEENVTPDLTFGYKDFRVATAVLYRMHYFEQGETLADQSDLFALIHNPFTTSDFVKAEIVRS